MRSKRVLTGLVSALVVVAALFALPAFADEGKDESGQKNEQEHESAKNDEGKNDGEGKSEDDSSDHDSGADDSGADDSADDDSADDEAGTSSGDDGEGDGSVRRRPARDRRPATSAGTAAMQAGQDEGGSGPSGESCPSGTPFKIDNLRSDGTYGPITISDFTNTSFTWTSTENVIVVLVKDGGGYKTNPGGTSGSASSLGQDVSHVIFCLGTAPSEGGEEEPCDETMPDGKPCEPKPPCVDDDEMAGNECAGVVPDVKVRPVTPDDVSVLGDRIAGDSPADRDAPRDVSVLAARAPQPTDAVLPFTGSPLAALFTTAMGLLLAGGGTLLIRRR